MLSLFGSHYSDYSLKTCCPSFSDLFNFIVLKHFLLHFFSFTLFYQIIFDYVTFKDGSVYMFVIHNTFLVLLNFVYLIYFFARTFVSRYIYNSGNDHFSMLFIFF